LALKDKFMEDIGMNAVWWIIPISWVIVGFLAMAVDLYHCHIIEQDAKKYD
jgi:Na+-driven multidrug efflux pump